MSLASPSVLLHKLSHVDITFLRTMLKVEGWLQSVSTPAQHLAVARASWDPTARPEVAELLSSGARISEQDADGNTVLHVAFLKFGGALVVDVLMDRYVRDTTRNLVNGDGLSVVHILCTRSHTQLLEKVLAGGRVNVNEKVHQSSTSIYAGYTPLHFAVEFDQHEVAELLLARYNANLYEQEAKGSTPLHLALDSGNLGMLDLLLAYDGGRKNVVNDRGLSHFMAACAGTDELAAKEYLQVAQLQLRRLICGTVLRFAVDFGRANVAGLLVATSKELTSVDFASSEQGSFEDLSSGSESAESSCGRGKSNVCTELICFALELFAFMMSLLLFLTFILLTIVMF